LGCLKLHIENDPRLRLAYSKKEVKPIKNTLSYYPFGLQQKGYNNTVTANSNSMAEKFAYNGIEQEKALGLNLYEMALRSYDPAIARFNGIDPVTHYSMGTSVAFDNNPPFFDTNAGGTASVFNTSGASRQRNEAERSQQQFLAEQGGECDDCNKCPETCSQGNNGADILSALGASPVVDGNGNQNFPSDGITKSAPRINPVEEESFTFYDFLNNLTYFLNGGIAYELQFGEESPQLIGALGIAGGAKAISTATKEANYVYRSLTSADATSLRAGKGLLAKAPNGIWSLEQHLIRGSSPKAWFNNPWIATSTDINIARSFSSGNGLVRINLSKLPTQSIQRGWMNLPRSSAGYHYSIWQSEVSIFQHVPQKAIKVIK